MADRTSIEVAALVFAESKGAGTFTANEFTGFVEMAGVEMEEEAADEILSDMAAAGKLRQIGPGVYAAGPAAEREPVPMEQPLWPEEATDGSLMK